MNSEIYSILFLFEGPEHFWDKNTNNKKNIWSVLQEKRGQKMPGKAIVLNSSLGF